jgi:membrane protease YdiL (CAAX protease family)
MKIGYDFLSESTKSYLKNQQEFNTTLQEKFIGESFISFCFNVFLLAIIPAIGEELFFRGLIQKIFIGIFKRTPNPVLCGVITTSIIFGILHFQIDNLLAIIFASIFFGYISEKSKNISLTIILHFCFNLFALINMQIIKIGLINENKIEFIGNYIVVPTGIIIAILMIKKKIFWKEKSLLSID